MKIVREHINEEFKEGGDPIEDLEIGTMTCTVCNGDGFYPEHDPQSYNPETGEHDCRYCPIQVPCLTCDATGYVTKTKSIDEKFSEKSDPIKDLGVGKLGMFKDLEKRGVRMWFNWENGEKEKLKIIENIVEITNLVNKLEATGCKPEEMEIIRSKDVRVKGCRVVINNLVVATCLTEKEAKIFIKCAKKFTMWNNNYTFQIRTNDFSEESVMVDPTQHRWLDNLIENRKNAKA